jgi:hypothetical protein
MPRSIRAASAILILTLFAVPRLSAGSESQTAADHGDGEHHTHHNHVSVFLGGSTHLNNGDTAVTVGAEYMRILSPRWVVTLTGESAASDIERDLILIAGGGYRIIPALTGLFGLGVEWADREKVHEGHEETEQETELLVRFGALYDIPLTPRWLLAPQFFADWTEHTWTLVYGVSVGYGF